jgi:hypothetical protein
MSKILLKVTKIIAFITCLVYTACSESDFDGSEIAGTSGRYLKVSDTSLTLESTAGSTASIRIECLKNAWQISDFPSWLTSTQQRGTDNTTVTISATEDNNSADHLRTCLFKIESVEKDWEYGIPVSVTQSKAIPSLNCEPQDEVALNYEAQTATITVRANCSWNFIAEEASWLKCKKMQDANIEISVEENKTNMSRVGYIYVKADNFNETRTIRLIQNCSNITSTTDNIEVGSHGGDYTINITSETSWTASCAQSWVNVNPQSGSAGTTEIHISISPNGQNSQRTAYLYITVGDVQRILIPIVQERSYVRPVNYDASLPSTGGSMEITILANDVWNIVPPKDASWLSFSVMSGNGNGSTTLTAIDNNSAKSRTAEVKFKTSLGVEYDIKIIQDGRYLRIAPEAVFFSKNGGESEPVEIETDGNYTFESTCDWITCRKGTTNSILFVSVLKNDNDNPREGFVNIRLVDLSDGSELSREIRVYQMGSASSSFFINRFSEEEKDWNFYNDAVISITLKGFSTTDKNWNPK